MLRYFGVRLPSIFHNKYISLFLSSIVVFILGYRFHRKTYIDLKNKFLGMEFLISFGSLLSFTYSCFVLFIYKNMNEVIFFDSAALIIYFAYLGKLIETKMKSKSIKNLKDFEKSIPNNFIKDGQILEIEKLRKGDIVTVMSNSKIPVDGIIIKGNPTVEESLITGEADMKEKRPGEFVYASTTNYGEEIQVLCESDRKDFLVNKIVKYIKKSEIQKTAIQGLADKITPYFTIVILFLAFIVFGLWAIFNFEPIWDKYSNSSRWEKAFKASISVIVISCPCALGLAGPLAVIIGVSRSAKKGIIFNSAKTFDKSEKYDIFLLDKTGTLTTQDIQIKNIVGDLNADNIKIIMKMTFGSEHPISNAIFHFLSDRNDFKYLNEIKVETVQGSGLTLKIKDDVYKLGKYSFATNIEDAPKEDRIYFSKNNIEVCYFSIERPIRHESNKFIDMIYEMGAKPVIVTGDNLNNTSKVAKSLKIKDFFTNCNPEKKKEIVLKFMKDNKRTCFIGDGINDSIAMKEADISISIGSSSKLAMSASDINIMSNNLNDVFYSFHIKKKIKRKIMSNYFWAFSYNLLAIPVAGLGLLLPWMAAGFMMFSEIIIIFNSLFLNIKNRK
jgi:P-type Cu+ transporter